MLRFKKKQKLNLDHIIKDVIELFSEIKDSDSIRYYSSQNKKHIFGCYTSLSRMLNNLINNALEASNKRNKKNIGIYTKTVLKNKTRRHIIIIKDYGYGIPEKMMYKIFEPYVSTKDHGRGLGLPIVKKIVEDHNGSIKIKSDRIKGTRVFVTLPEGIEKRAKI